VVLASVADVKPAETRRPDRVLTNLNPLATVAKRKFVAGESTYKP
jgi:hypothetical protein